MEDVGTNSWWSFLVDIAWYLHVIIYAAIWPRSLHWMKFFGLCMQMNQVIYVRGKSVLFYNFFCRSYDEDELMLQLN